jgi:hypothetical protein
VFVAYCGFAYLKHPSIETAIEQIDLTWRWIGPYHGTSLFVVFICLSLTVTEKWRTQAASQ